MLFSKRPMVYQLVRYWLPMLEVVLLAAGKSQRFGGVKQCAMYNGRPLLEHCIEQFFENGNLIKGIAQITVVVGANEQQVRTLNLKKVRVYSAQHWQRGMGASLGEFVEQIEACTSHLLVGLADQIAITGDDIKHLIAESSSSPESIVVSQYQQLKSAPAIFPRYFFKELSALQGDKGARMLFSLYPDCITGVDLPHAAIDIDTQEDLEIANKQSIKK